MKRGVVGERAVDVDERSEPVARRQGRGAARGLSVDPDCLGEPTVVAYLEGTLSTSDKASVDAHVDGCRSCLALVAALGRVEASESATRGDSQPEDPVTSADAS